MSYFTKAEARSASQRFTSTQIAKNATIHLNESRSHSKDTDSFDVFLSHSINDAEIVLGVKRLLEQFGLKVYVDWETDSQLDRSRVSAATADLLRKRMKQSKSLIFLATESASTSKWMPWELGYFDGFRGGMVSIMPVLEKEHDTFAGQEYLGLYPTISKGTYSGTQQEEVFVKGATTWTTLKTFGTGNPTWRKYG